MVAKGDTLRICHLGMKQVPSRQGGIEVVVEQLATRMAALGHKVTCYNRRGHHICGREFDAGKPKKYKGVRLVYLPTINYRGFAAMTASISGAVCAAFGKYDIVHFHAEGPAFMCWLPTLFGKKVIVTIHGLDWQRAKWGNFASFVIKFGEKMAAKYADGIIVLSKNVQQYFQDTYGRDTVFIPNGINSPQKKPAELIAEQYGLKGNDYFLFLARIVPEKGIHYLIEAFRQIETDKKLVIAGGSSQAVDYMEMVHRMAAEDERIIMTNFVQGQMLEELYSNAYAFVLPSDVEGMAVSLLEAMSYGNCCLVSDICENTEVVEDKALTFRRGNIEDLRKKLEYMLSHPEVVEEYKKQSSEYICGKYNWEDIVEQTVQVYENIDRQ